MCAHGLWAVCVVDVGFLPLPFAFLIFLNIYTALLNRKKLGSRVVVMAGLTWPWLVARGMKLETETGKRGSYRVAFALRASSSLSMVLA
jgi:hypothetical protein